MGQCISKKYKSHNEIKEQFTLQYEKKKKKKLVKMNTENLGMKTSNKFKKQNSKANFKMKDFVNKNYNSLIEEYR
jgi:hypothetical protein